MRNSNGCSRRSALSYGKGASIGRGGCTGRGGGTSRGGGTGRGGSDTGRGNSDISKGQRRRPCPRPKAKPSASLGHAWISEEMERVERFSALGKGK